jgi:hypothetical protein
MRWPHRLRVLIELTRLRPPTTGREVGYGKRLLAGGTAGGMGISVLNPMEVIKTQLQASGPAKTSAAEIFKRVLRTDGVLGFWAGGAMPIARRATYHPVLLSACMCATKLSREKQALAQTSPAPSWCVRRSLEPTTRSKHSCCHGMCSQMGPWPTCAPALPLRLCPRAPPRPWMLSKHAS